MNDEGYNSVLKEYDFYHSNDNDFEIIEEYSNKPNINKNIKNNMEIKKNQNEKLQNFIFKIFKIIFNSRNKRSEFSSNSKSKLNDNKTNNSSFTVDIEELIEYDNLKAWDDSDGDKKKKYIIDFYLLKNDNEQDKESLKSVKTTDKQKLLVERWKIKYNENFNFSEKTENFAFLEKKMKIIEKNIVTYSRVLPLYNISKDDNYSIDFKFNPNIKKGKKYFVDEKSTQKIKIKNKDLYSFKLSIQYLKIKPENIELFFNKNNYDFVIIPSNKSRRRFLSDTDTYTYNKKSSQYILNNIDHNNENKLDDNKDKEVQNPSFIIENYITDRKHSYEDNNIQKYIKSKFDEDEKEKKLDKSQSLSNENSDDDLSLVIDETNSDSGYKPNENENKKNNIRKMTYDYYNINNTKENIPRKSQTLKNPKNIKKKEIDNLKNFDCRNNFNVKKIVQDYKIMRKMIKMMPKFDNIKYNKLSTFIFSN